MRMSETISKEQESVPVTQCENMQWLVWLLLMALGTSLNHCIKKGGKSNDILSVLCGQNSAIINALNPEVMAFRNKVTELQKDCPMVEWEHDMGATIPYCKLDKAFCNGQCSLKMGDCPCDTDRR